MKLPNLKGLSPSGTPVYKMMYNGQKMTKDIFKDLIWKYHGIITLVCMELNINFPQFYRAVDKWDLREELKKAKQAYIDAAEATLFEALDSKDESTRLRAADTILKYSKPKQGQEIVVKDGEVSIKSIFGIE